MKACGATRLSVRVHDSVCEQHIADVGGDVVRCLDLRGGRCRFAHLTVAQFIFIILLSAIRITYHTSHIVTLSAHIALCALWTPVLCRPGDWPPAREPPAVRVLPRPRTPRAPALLHRPCPCRWAAALCCGTLGRCCRWAHRATAAELLPGARSLS